MRLGVVAGIQSRANRRATARRLLERFDLAGVASCVAAEPQIAGDFQRLLFDDEEVVAWRAVEALGRIACVSSAERVRDLLGRTLWLMNEESGGILWKGPQVLGSVLAHVPVLSDEFGPVLAGFLEEEPFRAATRWGLWRVSSVAPPVVRQVAPALRASLREPVAAIRGLSALALRGAGEDLPALDDASFVVFDFRTGEFRRTSVSAAAAGRD